MVEQPWNQNAGDTENQCSFAIANRRESKSSASKQTFPGKQKTPPKPTQANPHHPRTNSADNKRFTVLYLLICLTILHLSVINVCTVPFHNQNSTGQSFHSHFQPGSCTLTQKQDLKLLPVLLEFWNQSQKHFQNATTGALQVFFCRSYLWAFPTLRNLKHKNILEV